MRFALSLWTICLGAIAGSVLEVAAIALDQMGAGCQWASTRFEYASDRLGDWTISQIDSQSL